eukprot:3943097-Prymnesium_polylepis.1
MWRWAARASGTHSSPHHDDATPLNPVRCAWSSAPSPALNASVERNKGASSVTCSSSIPPQSRSAQIT